MVPNQKWRIEIIVCNSYIIIFLSAVGAERKKKNLIFGPNNMIAEFLFALIFPLTLFFLGF